jgi:hypothetical protein
MSGTIPAVAELFIVQFTPSTSSQANMADVNEHESEIVRREFDHCLQEWRDARVNRRGSYVADSGRWRTEQTLEIGVALGVMDRAASEERMLAVLRYRPGS